MRSNVWLAITLAMILPVMLFTASCAKKVVQTDLVSTNEPEVQKEPDKPAEKVSVPETVEPKFVNEDIYFAFDSSSLSDQAREILDKTADYLRTNPELSMTVEGHCDERGTEAYNLALGERRAESVKTFLVDMGIDTSRLKTVSYGEERPVATGHGEAAWARNRRAQFDIN
jgi:peptidoglycan-associated lipoprotein